MPVGAEIERPAIFGDKGCFFIVGRVDPGTKVYRIPPAAIGLPEHVDRFAIAPALSSVQVDDARGKTEREVLFQPINFKNLQTFNCDDEECSTICTIKPQS